jgi:hypothetical protein
MSLDVSLTRIQPTEVYHDSITHNLGKMAREAGLYEALWRPEEIGVTTAQQLAPLLRVGLEVLKGHPEKFQRLNPSNGWGTYEGLVQFVQDYLDACLENPDATVEAGR